jgi:hypothetical protein
MIFKGGDRMNNRQVETSREIRLWVTGIIGPVLIGAATIFASNPELLNDASTAVKQKIKNFRKKGEETL